MHALSPVGRGENSRGKGENPMLIKKASDIKSAEITAKALYLDRRRFLQTAAAGALTIAAASLAPGSSRLGFAQAREKLEGAQKSPLSTDEPLTPYKDI